MLINCKGVLLNMAQPIVMGILNITPDSFFDGGKWDTQKAILEQATKIITEGASIIDIGGMSTRPGAELVTEEEELNRVLPAIKLIIEHFPKAIISIDTIRATVAKKAIDNGASIINDISGGTYDEQMIPTVALLKVPYIIMHKQGMPVDMQKNPTYNNVVIDVLDFLEKQVYKCNKEGISDTIIDVGFGFGKKVEHNFELLKHLSVFKQLGCPILAGLSRKSMINKVLNLKATEALNGTTALNMVALLNGANILRVHDVKEAVETVKLYNILNTTVQ